VQSVRAEAQQHNLSELILDNNSIIAKQKTKKQSLLLYSVPQKTKKQSERADT
jgi:hypothetical protein